MHLKEAELIAQAQAGDPAAFEQLYELYHEPIFSYIFYRVGHQHLAEDLAGDTFVKMVSKIHLYKPGGKPFLAWLYTVAGNLVRDTIRREKRLSWVPIDERDILSQDSLITMIGKKLKQEQLVSALHKLTEDQRQVIVLRFIEGYTSMEVADRLGKTVTGIKALQRRAIKSLRNQLEKEGAFA